jgi:hypothetical protein
MSSLILARQFVSRHTDQTLSRMTILSVKYCPRTNLPMVPLALSTSMEPWYCFWSDDFGYSIQAYKEIIEIKSVLHQTNSNLSSSQKEVLLWHQCLSHASTNWMQTLMRDRKWLLDTIHVNAGLHSGPFIVMKSCAPHCVVSHIKCAMCLFAKASTWSPPTMAPRLSSNNLMLKPNHLAPGDCVSADHYFSPVQGRLLHTFGNERVGFTCGC